MKRIITSLLLAVALLAIVPVAADAKYYMDKYEAKSYIRTRANKIVRSDATVRWFQIYDCYRVTRSRWNCGVDFQYNDGDTCETRWLAWYNLGYVNTEGEVIDCN